MATKKTAQEKAPANDKKAALETVMARIERECGRGSIMRLGESSSLNVSAVSTGSLALDFALGVVRQPLRCTLSQRCRSRAEPQLL